MKLTPIDIQQQQFRRSFRGFEQRGVSGFLELVSQQMGETIRENNEMRGDLRRTQRELEEYREREETLKQAMLTAQNAIDEIREQAKKEAKLLLTEAELRAEKLVYDAHQRVNRVLDGLQDLKQQRLRAIEELRHVLDTHEKLLAIHEEEARTMVQSPEATITVLKHVKPPEPPSLQQAEEAAMSTSSAATIDKL